MILVTGCAGFLGSNLCYHLTKNGDIILGIDCLTKQSNFEWIEKLIKKRKLFFYKIDIRDGQSLRWLFSNFEIDRVVHLAAETHVDRSIDSPEGFWDTNVMGTLRLMDVARKKNIKLFINQATDEIMGEKPMGEAFEGDPLKPTSPYACSKAAQYLVGKSFYLTYSFPVISTIPVNCFGPRQNKEKIVPKFIHQLLVLDQPVPLMASTHFERDWLPVDDFCSAISHLLEWGKPGEDYNIGAGNHRSNLQLTKEILKICNKQPEEKYIEIVPDRKTHDCRYAVNSNKLRSLGSGWKPIFDFLPYLAYTINWYSRFYEEKGNDSAISN